MNILTVCVAWCVMIVGLTIMTGHGVELVEMMSRLASLVSGHAGMLAGPSPLLGA